MTLMTNGKTTADIPPAGIQAMTRLGWTTIEPEKKTTRKKKTAATEQED
ncbi:hypothetical protein QP921_02725 [Corynebacterium pseudodiphtheriticum]|nr:hypothetical protein [Corynebacterium pseudodiphtheriticum]MCT1635018.1 hypothetical protein [Corynebacterium pseudodiphtheriticum]MCT1666111.1 hypothetical protein [Corynebacterium pseudodiphtheriticum]MDK8550767.1 hypothetical protein [Corynebacterium pseudodiphtheriticum]MDK8717439.1 hypothetical protein [Corynebacterium pseudodiphtheriticum]MDK8760669.1 hypothetical protein [Corynebacterium pseudodiphtheriticum]